MNVVGAVREMYRYPVKSFAGERLEMSCRIEEYGVYGDRWYAFVDERKEGWDRFVTARQYPAMLGYRAELIENAADGGPRLCVTSPDGRSLAWDEELLRDVQTLGRTKLSMHSCIAEGGPQMAVDDSAILIVTNRSLDRLASLWGKPLDRRRFRANLLLELADGAPPETEWIGKRLALGGAELQIEKNCERCSLITLDPETRERDATLLQVVHRELNLHFGAYASVVRSGSVAAGDPVRLQEAGE